MGVLVSCNVVVILVFVLHQNESRHHKWMIDHWGGALNPLWIMSCIIYSFLPADIYQHVSSDLSWCLWADATK